LQVKPMKRKLTDDEHRLWANVIRAVRPLRSPRPASEASASETLGPQEPESGPLRPSGHPSRPARPQTRGSAQPPPLATLARRDKQRLARGLSSIDARLDLHGMTQAQAHMALARFLGRAQADGAKFVLVITGTGARGAAGERGVLRRQVPLWLNLPEFRSFVLGFEQAHIGHGGEGAFYVRLRRQSRDI
jgi:DNA-nicking Smr family endonuclease